MKKLNRIISLLLTTILCVSAFSIPVSAALLKSGSRGTEVKRLQMNLYGLAYAKITADGIYGSKTVAAVKKFQSANGLATDGIAGDQTLSRIKSIVTELQNDLKSLGYGVGTSDGIYGTNTKNAVKKFQRAYGLSADGIAGSKTMSKLSSVKMGNVTFQTSSSYTSVSNSSSVIVTTDYHSTPSKVVTYSLKRDGNKYITKNFKVKEFRSKDGADEIKIDHKLAALLQNIRDHFGRTVTINSAYRSKQHNAKVGGKPSSLHLAGKAADIKISGVTPLKLAQYAQSLGVKGIGRYSWGIHVDTRTSKFYWYSDKIIPISSFR